LWNTPKKNGAINSDLMTVIYAHQKVEQLKIALNHAEAELAHAVRGLEHPDYDAQFS
jgi:hypothetical protein